MKRSITDCLKKLYGQEGMRKGERTRTTDDECTGGQSPTEAERVKKEKVLLIYL